MRILALDVGTKTIGVAVSDPMGWTAQGVTTIHRRGESADREAIAALVREYEATEILVGLPLNMNGTEGPQAALTRRFAKGLEQNTAVPIAFWDERLSTVAAERALLEADLSREKRKRVIDKMAAVHFLQGYLDSKKR